jgi:uncharacterized protein
VRLVTRSLALLLVLSAFPAAAQNVELELRPGETLLQVDAVGKHPSRPDMMRFEAGIVSTGRTAREATEANAALAQRLVETLRAAGVEARDVRTTTLRLTPRLERRRDDVEEVEPRILGYVARNALDVRVRDIRRGSAILDSLIAAGANEVNGPIFELGDDRAAIRSARTNAVAAAREEADAYAAALGMRVARVLRLGERNVGASDEGFITVTGSRLQGTPIEPGEIETQARVWIDYALAPR